MHNDEEENTNELLLLLDVDEPETGGTESDDDADNSGTSSDLLIDRNKKLMEDRNRCYHHENNNNNYCYCNNNNNDDDDDDDKEKREINNNHNQQEQQQHRTEETDQLENNREQYHRQSMLNLEDQFETSKLVLQLVTDSSFNMTQINGQRKLGGPPPGWKGPPPGPGCEVFVGKIPRTLYEHEIYPIFSKMGEVYEIRLMMDFSGTNRGYCFVMFGRPEFAQRAIRELNDFEIRPGRKIGVVASINNCRLYVGQLPPDISSESVIKKIYDITDDVGQVAVYRNANGQARYALISYKTHRGAAMARRRLVPERASLFGGVEVSIDWAHPGMFPSNVVEESGTTNEQGNIIMSRMIVGNENRRYQTRRRARDEFLDSSIKSYIESDRALENSSTAPRGRQHASQQQLQQRGLDRLNGYNGTTKYDRESKSSSTIARSGLDSVFQGGLKAGKKESGSRNATSEIAIKSSNSSFDLINNHRGSCSSESSISSSKSDHGIVNSAMNNLFSRSTDCFKNFENWGEYLSSESGVEMIKDSASSSSTSAAANDSFNLFESYSFFTAVAAAAAAATAADILPDNSITGSSNSSSAKNNSGHFSSGIDDSETEEGNEYLLKDSRKKFVKQSRRNQDDNDVVTFIANPGNSFLNNGSTETISKATGAVPKKKTSRSDSSNFLNPTKILAQSTVKSGGKITAPQNFQNSQNFEDIHLPRQNGNFRGSWQLPTNNFGNLPRVIENRENARYSLPQNRNGISSLIFDKNSENEKAGGAMVANFNPRNCPQRNGYYNIPNPINVNANAKRAWLSAQLRSNDCDFSSNNVSGVPNFFKTVPHFSSSNFVQTSQSRTQLQLQFSGANEHSSNVDANSFNTGQNLANFTQDARFRIAPTADYQNRAFSAGHKNGQKIGRPILSRSYANSCDEN